MTELEQMGKRAKEAARELAFAGDKKSRTCCNCKGSERA